jgi:hypothetical protein
MLVGAAIPGAASARSWPAQKARPAPVSRTARIASSSAAACSACCSSAAIGMLKLFRTSGRLSVIVATPCSAAKLMK